ncbi:MAG: O-antigen ligase family protein [Desulfovibrio sp.]|nr:O-antigen ligase family protein [Desulfovibrio sp.]
MSRISRPLGARMADILSAFIPDTKDAREAFFFKGMFASFSVYLVFFSSGYGFREVLPPVSFCFLLGLYKTAYERSTLCRFTPKTALLAFLLFLLWSVATSVDMWDSFLHVGRGINKQFMVFFIALECAKGRKEVRTLVLMCFLGVYLQSLSCVYQAMTGFDIIHHDAPIAGRLTGTMAWYWVGSYIVLAGIPALSLWREIRKKLGPVFAPVVALAMASPVLFAIIRGGARASFLSGLAVLAILFLLQGRKTLRIRLLLLLSAVSLLLLLLFLAGEGRFSLAGIFGDSRFQLWKQAYHVFLTDPVSGVGAWQYRTVFQTLPEAQNVSHEFFTLSHPHNVYMQVLCETGIAGFLLAFGSVFTLFSRHTGRLLAILRNPEERGKRKETARMGLFFSLACLAFFVHGLVGHDFFRPWYQALFLCHLGILCGTSVRLSIAEQSS